MGLGVLASYLQFYILDHLSTLMNKTIRRGLKITGILLGVLVVAAFAAPFVFKGKILSLVKKEINANLNAVVEFEDLDISFFRRFPQVSLQLKNLSVTGTNAFAGDTLLSTPDLGVAVHFFSLFKSSDIKVRSVELKSPRIQLLVDSTGLANWDIAKTYTTSSTGDSTSSAFKINLEDYSLTDGYLLYQDEASHLRTELKGVDHEGSGDLSADDFVLKTKTDIREASLVYEGIPYLAGNEAHIVGDIQANIPTSKYSFADATVQLNNLLVKTNGFFQLETDSTYLMDIKFAAPSTDFKDLLSLVPAMYSADFKDLKTSGTALFNGFVKGRYGPSEMPAYDVKAEVKDGFFQYPELPKPVSDIQLQLHAFNPDGQPDHAVMDLSRGHLKMDNQPFDFKLLYKNPETVQYLDALVKGRIDLGSISRFIKLPAGTKLGGLLDADAFAQGSMNALQTQTGAFRAGGYFNLNDFLYASSDLDKPIRNGQIKANIINQSGIPDETRIDIPQGHIEWGQDPFDFNVKLTKPMTVLSLIGSVTGRYMNTGFTAKGDLQNVQGFLLNTGTLKGVVDLTADQLDLNQWMGTTASTDTNSTSSSGPFLVPAGLDLLIRTKAGSVRYDKVDYQNINGLIQIAQETVTLKELKTEALGGTITLNGSYSTLASKKDPAISIDYDIDKVDAQKAFMAFNTVQMLMPIGQFIGGSLSSEFAMTGKLNDQMMPLFNSLTGKGNFLLLNGFLSKFKPLEKIASTLQIDQLKEISVKDIKNYIEFANGKVLVKPFTVKVRDIEMEIGGLHGLDQSIDYVIQMKVPRKYLGNQANLLVNDLVTKATAKGIPVQMGETVNLVMKMGGSLTNPTLRTELKEAAGNAADELKNQAVAFAKEKADTAKATIRDSANALKKEITEDIKKGIQNEIKNKLFGKDTAAVKDTAAGKPLEDTKKKSEQKVKNTLDKLLNRKKQNPPDTAKGNN